MRDGETNEHQSHSDAPNVGSPASLAMAICGVFLGTVALVLFAILARHIAGVYTVGAAQLYPYIAFCAAGAWVTGFAFRRKPRWWSYVAAGLIGAAANLTCLICIY